ncbi:MAG: PD-(D/E)XK nuclease family protein [Eubacterium sp.]
MLQLILGTAGSGKTEYVFSSIKSLIDSGEKDILLITPEQFSFIAERRLLSDLGEQKINLIENSSFSRLSNEISRQYGGDKFPVLSKGSKAVMMKKAIEMVQDELVLFNININHTSFINSVIKIYDEMKSCRVTADEIVAAADCVEKEILKQKLHDISLIIAAYDALISDKYYDSANELSRLYERLLNLDYFEGRTVFIDGFSGFVAQEYKIIEVIIKQAKAVYITFCSNSDINSDKFDLFSYVNMNISILKQLARKANVAYKAPVFLNKNRRAENDELRLVEKYCYNKIKKSADFEPENIKLYSAKNISDECDHASSEISKLLREGITASEVAVVCRDLEKYEHELEFSFNKYNIPYFKDERQNISSQPLIMLVSFLLRIAVYSFRSEDIFSLLKTGLTALDDDSVCSLENYVYMWSINGSKWKNEFIQSTKGFAEKITENDKKQLKNINDSRDYIVSRLEKFCHNVKKRSCRDICKAIYFTLIDLSADTQLKALAVKLDNSGKSALAKEQGRIWDLLMQILDRLALVGGDELISIKDFSKLFSLMISNEDLGSLPSGLDNVQIGSADRMRCDNPSVIFIVGANEGEFPQSVSSAGLLSESDRIALISNDFKLYSYGETLNAQERYFAYMAMCSCRKKLYVSYRGGSNDSAESSIVNELRAIFPNLKTEIFDDDINIDKVESIDNAFEILASNYTHNNEIIESLKTYFENRTDYVSRLNAVKTLTDNKDIVIKDTALATKLFSKDIYLSASKIEEYFQCSFRYFCKFGIGAKPRTKAEMDPMQTGTVIHYVLEKIISKKGSKGLTELSSNEIAIIVNKYLDEFLNTKMGNSSEFTPRFKYQFMRLSKMLQSVVERLKEEFDQSDFEAKALELKIGNGDEGEPVKSKIISLPDGGSISIKGSIDRVDVYNENGTQYVRVVDYKSGNKKFLLSDILYGLNLQMFIYLFTLCQSNHELSGINAGVLYMHSARSILSLDRNADDSILNSKANQTFKMKGVVLNDENNEIAEHMEHSLGGKYIPVKYSKKDGITGNIVTLEELGRISRKIDNLVAQMGVNLHNGMIMQNPVDGKYHDKTCEYCDYKSICMNRREINNRVLDDFDNNQTLEMLKEGDVNA